MNGEPNDDDVNQPSRADPALTPDARTLVPASSLTASGLHAGERDIGEYHLIEVIGEGGMGVIYKAEQRGAIRRVVALKVIKLGLDTKVVIARFEAERQALALMNHPNIAKVFDAGSTPLGRPYFVMEYVPGEPITTYCDKHKLSIRRRLELFGQVCEALQHAHTKGVIHRDLKASNVLVMETDGRPVPKVIDFGVAKATNQRLTEQTLFTETGHMIGTPAYMSPEQAEGGVDVDTRSDVYSLGVLLYELLTGSLPFDPAKLRQAAYGEMQRIIREDEPPRPSTFYSHVTDASKAAAQRRAATVEELASTLRSELEWIPLRAMRKERANRYETAAQFAGDIENYLSGRPLIAAPDSRTYRFKKAIRRNRATVATAAAVMLALLLGLASTTWQAYRATKAEQAALRRLERQQAMTYFLDAIFSGLDPNVMQEKDPALLFEVLKRAEARLEQDLPNAADRAGYMHFLGDLYRKFNERERARPLLEQGLALSRDVFRQAVEQDDYQENDYEVVRLFVIGCHRYVAFLNQHHDYETSLRLAQEARQAVVDYMPATHPEQALREADLAVALDNCGRRDEAEVLLKSALQRMTAHPESVGDTQRGTVLKSLAVLLSKNDKLQEAEAMYAQAAALYERAPLGDSTTPYANLQIARAVLACKDNRPADALEILNHVTAIHERILKDPLHPNRRVEWDTRAKALAMLDRHGEAADAMIKAIEVAASISPPNETYLAAAHKHLVNYLRQAGRVGDASEWEQRAKSLAQKQPDPAGPAFSDRAQLSADKPN